MIYFPFLSDSKPYISPHSHTLKRGKKNLNIDKINQVHICHINFFLIITNMLY